MKPPILGAQLLSEGRCAFTLWAPLKESIALHLVEPDERIISLERAPHEMGERGYWQVTVDAVEAGALYYFRIDGKDYADPASRLQPQGVHGPSAVVGDPVLQGGLDLSLDPARESDWTGLSLAQYVIYELHVGTFTPEGSFEAIIPRLAALKALGITAIELMPVAEFPGHRNWGYDGTFPFAVQTSYGGVAGLKALIQACHSQGIAVILDVVYNHLGPEGNYLWHLGTYFTDRYKTPWGSAVNYDSAYSDGVREYVIQNALYWLGHLEIDALRLDAVHAIYDFGGLHILKEMRDRVSQLSGPPRYLIAESDLNDPRIIESAERGGYGLDAQWSDDFHHALHTVLTGETRGYYADFGQLSQLAQAYENAFVYAWDYSKFRQRMHGYPAKHCPSQQFVVSAQNHDQVGNRMLGDRFSHLLDFERQKLAAAALLLAPFVPMLFMGEEYGETAPFLYFVNHGDSALIESVRQGRKQEFADFQADGEAPDPQAPETFEASKLNWALKDEGQHRLLWNFYRMLLQLRREDPVLTPLDHQRCQAKVQGSVLMLRRWQDQGQSQTPSEVRSDAEGDVQILAWMNFGDRPAIPQLPAHPATWQRVLNSADVVWGGPGHDVPESLPIQRDPTATQQPLELAPHSVVVYRTTPKSSSLTSSS